MRTSGSINEFRSNNRSVVSRAADANQSLPSRSESPSLSGSAFQENVFGRQRLTGDFGPFRMHRRRQRLGHTKSPRHAGFQRNLTKIPVREECVVVPALITNGSPGLPFPASREKTRQIPEKTPIRD